MYVTWIRVCRFVTLKKKTRAFETPTGRDDFPAERGE